MRRPATRWSRRLVAGTALVLAVGLLASPPASAHNALRSTSPSADARLAHSPAEITLTFDEPAIAMGTQVIVTGPSGPVQTGPARLVDNTVTQSLAAGAPAGDYRVDWRVTSADGHPVSGSFRFSSLAAAPAGSDTTAPTAPPTPSGGSGGATGRWLIQGVLVGLLVLGGILVLRRSRERRTKPGAERRRREQTAVHSPGSSEENAP